MATPFNLATAAYGNAARLVSQGGNAGANPLGGAGASSGPDFASLLAETVQGVVDEGRRSEAVALDMLSGKANVVDMVTAISQTEIAIETMVTVRDRVISAYEEIMRMPI